MRFLLAPASSNLHTNHEYASRLEGKKKLQNTMQGSRFRKRILSSMWHHRPVTGRRKHGSVLNPNLFHTIVSSRSSTATTADYKLPLWRNPTSGAQQGRRRLERACSSSN